MADFLDILAQDAKERIKNQYYTLSTKPLTPLFSLKKRILESKHVPIIPEIKAASPSLGVIRKDVEPEKIAVAMEKGGAVGLSILTEPKHFHGSLFSLLKARRAVNLPLLMKDIIINPIQLEAASKIGADTVLFIDVLFQRGYCEIPLQEMIAEAHRRRLEVLLETHNKAAFQKAIESDADLIGINNRDLITLKVDLNRTRRILEKKVVQNKIIVSESGINTPADISFLRNCGAHAFLIGSTIMSASNIEEKVKEFVSAY
jgi:indole-3-glycerol phosphate synthase